MVPTSRDDLQDPVPRSSRRRNGDGSTDGASLRLAALEASFQSAADAVILYRRDGSILEMNPAARRMLGYDPAHEAKPLSERLPALHATREDGRPLRPEDMPVWRAFRGEAVAPMIVHIQPEHAPPRWVSLHSAPMKDPEGTLLGAVAVVSDVTRLFELRRRHQDAARAVSHDLRTPLSALMVHAQHLERLLRRDAPPNRMLRPLAGVLHTADRMARMIDELGQSLQLESGAAIVQPEDLDLHACLKDLVQRSGVSLPADRIRLRLHPQPLHARADPAHLDRIVLNLVSNALKYGPPDAPVDLRTRPEGPFVEIAVIDHGGGLADEELERLFERFYRGRGARSASGLGLGLFITRSLVDAQGGRIYARSGEGRTEFRVLLPRALPCALPAAAGG